MTRYKKNKKKRTKNIILIISILILLALIIFSIFYYQDYQKIDYKNTFTINVGEQIPNIEQYISSKDIKKIKSKKIDWDNLNPTENTIYIPGTYAGKIHSSAKEITVTLNVIDNLAPIIEGVKNIEIYQNDSIDLLKDITVTDNSQELIIPTIEGEYKTSQIGEYNLKYTAKDSSNNESSISFKLTVKEKPATIIGTTSKGYTIAKKNGITYVNNILIANKTYSLPSTYAPGGLTSATTKAFNEMKSDAKSLGLNIKITSGYRSYYDQRYIYNNYVKEDGQTKADTYSARAGHSEHQSGLAFDLNSISMYFISTNEGIWVNDNCYRYGFIIRYPSGKESITGYQYEPWHLRYVGKELAQELYNNGDWITLEEYLGIPSKYQ